MRFEGSQNAINAALNGLTYRAPLNTSGTGKVAIQVDDLGNFPGPYSGITGDAFEINVRPNLAPVLSGFTGTGNFTENGTSTYLAPTATLSDSDSADFSGGTLTASISANPSSADILTILSQTPGAGRITVSGSVVSYSGIAIGNVSGGSNGVPLSVALNSMATPAAVQMLVRNISFRVNSENPSTAIRTIIVVMTDGDRGTSNQAPKQINVVAVNDPPIISGVTAAVNYTRGKTPVRPALSAVVTDPDNANFNGGILTVFSASGANSADRITFAGYLVDSLGRISRNGKLIGTRNANGGVGTTGLNIRLTANATIAELQLLVRSLLFETTATTAGSRILEFRLSDGTGGNEGPVRTNIRVL